MVKVKILQIRISIANEDIRQTHEIRPENVNLF